MHTTADPDDRVCDVRFSGARMTVTLRDGREITVPLTLYPALLGAAPSARREWNSCGAGYGIEWPRIDYHLSVAGILAGRPEARGHAEWRRANPLPVPPHAARKRHGPRTAKRPVVRNSAALPGRPTSAPAASRTASVASRTRKSGLNASRKASPAPRPSKRST